MLATGVISFPSPKKHKHGFHARPALASLRCEGLVCAGERPARGYRAAGENEEEGDTEQRERARPMRGDIQSKGWGSQ